MTEDSLPDPPPDFERSLIMVQGLLPDDEDRRFRVAAVPAEACGPRLS